MTFAPAETIIEIVIAFEGPAGCTVYDKCH